MTGPHYEAHLDAAVNLARAAIQSVILINGGAAVAIVTLLGTGFGRELPTTVYVFSALACFAVGAGFGVAGGISGYLSQLAAFQDIDAGEVNSEWWRDVAIGFVVASVVAFFFGAGTATYAFVSVAP